MTKLETLLKEISENKRCADIEKAFEEVAIELIQNSILVAGNFKYFIREIEFYFWSLHHPDPYVHKKNRQLEFGEWYFHSSGRKGLDLTFGNKENKNYGGILLRGIENIEKNEKAKPLNGPSKIVNLLSENIGKDEVVRLSKIIGKSVFFNESILRVEHFEKSQNIPLPTMRHGLTLKPNGGIKFAVKEYRYIYPSSEYKFPRKEIFVTEWVKNEKIKEEEGWALLNYRKNFNL